MGRFRRDLIGVFSVLALLAVGCGDDGNGDVVATPESSQVESSVSTAPSEGSETESPPATVPAGWSGVPAPECDHYNDLAVGSDATIWAGGVGLNTFDGGEWRRLTEEDGLPVSDRAGAISPGTQPNGAEPCESTSPQVHDVVVAPDGTIWLTTVDSGGGFVVSYDGTSFEQYPYPGEVAPETFSEYLRVDGDGDVWFPTFERTTTMAEGDEGPVEEVTEPFTGVARLRDEGGWEEFPFGTALWPPPAFAVGPDGVAWLVSPDSVHELSDGSWAKLDVADLMALGEIGFPAAGPDGLWVGVHQGGTQVALAHRVDDVWVVETEGLPDLFGQYVIDPTGLVWGTLWQPEESDGFAGLASFDGEVWTLHPAEDLSPFGTPGPPYLLAADGSAVLIGTPAGFGDLFRFGTG